jgi:hypothetical protein
VTAYRRGADFERRVKARLEERGWTVFRTAGSHSPADLIAVCLADTYDDGFGAPVIPRLRLVQCKSGKTAMTKKERAAFRDFADGLGAEAVVFLRGMKEEAA